MAAGVANRRDPEREIQSADALLPGLADVDVRVDEVGYHPLAASIDGVGIAGNAAFSGRADAGDTPTGDRHPLAMSYRPTALLRAPSDPSTLTPVCVAYRPISPGEAHASRASADDINSRVIVSSAR